MPLQTDQSKQSEVGRVLERIELEYVAAQRGMMGFAEGARHAFITARLERMGALHEDLRAIVGDDATRLLVERLETVVVQNDGSGQRKRED